MNCCWNSDENTWRCCTSKDETTNSSVQQETDQQRQTTQVFVIQIDSSNGTRQSAPELPTYESLIEKDPPPPDYEEAFQMPPFNLDADNRSQSDR